MDIKEGLKKKGDHAMAIVRTVANNTSRYNKRDYLNYLQARKLQKMIGQPTTEKILGYIKNEIIYNCPVTISKILDVEDIFGPDVGALKGKTTRIKPFRVHGRVVKILAQIIERYKKVILSVYIMTGSSPRCPLRYHYLVHSKKNSDFVGI